MYVYAAADQRRNSAPRAGIHPGPIFPPIPSRRRPVSTLVRLVRLATVGLGLAFLAVPVHLVDFASRDAGDSWGGTLEPSDARADLRVIGGDTLRTSEPTPPRPPAAPEAPAPPGSASEDDRPGRIRIDIEIGEEDEAGSDGRSRWRRERSSGGHQTLFRMGEDYVVEEDETVEGSIVSLGGDITVLGFVEGDIVVLGGDIRLQDGSAVDGDVNSIGGRVIVSRGADLGGEKNEISGPAHFNMPLSNPVVVVLSFAFLLLIGWLVFFLSPRRFRGVVETVRTRMWGSFFTGLLTHLALFPVIVILLITLIGIPLAVLLPFFHMVMMCWGFVAVATLVGSKVLDVQEAELTFRGMALGLFLLLGFLTLTGALRDVGGPFGLLGGLLSLFALALNWVAATLGLGAVLMSKLGGSGAGPAAAPGTPGYPPPPGYPLGTPPGYPPPGAPAPPQSRGANRPPAPTLPPRPDER